MICHKCNAEIMDNSKFCSNCGCRIDGEAKAPVQYVASTPEELIVGEKMTETPGYYDESVKESNLRVEKMKRNQKIFMGVLIGCFSLFAFLLILVLLI